MDSGSAGCMKPIKLLLLYYTCGEKIMYESNITPRSFTVCCTLSNADLLI